MIQTYIDTMDIGHDDAKDKRGNSIMGLEISYEVVKIDESFDYAGTHCTGGKSGTHEVTSQSIEDFEVISYNYETASGDILEGKIEDIPKPIFCKLTEDAEDFINNTL